MPKCSSLVLCILLSCCGTALAAGGISPEILDRGKRATAFIEVTGAYGTWRGSGFCIDRSGLFITSARIIEKATQGAEIQLVLDTRLASQRKLTATLLSSDYHGAGLALLQARGGEIPAPLELGRDADLKKLAPVFALGYPAGKESEAGKDQYPRLRVLTSRISLLHSGGFRAIEKVYIDDQMDPGLSGGPLLDESGRVAGISVANTGELSVAKPVGFLAEFLAKPSIVLDVATVAFETRTRSAEWTIHLQPPAPLLKLPERLSVTVMVGNFGNTRTYTAQPVGGGVFKATVVPDPYVELNVYNAASQALVELDYLPDNEVKVGDKHFRLSELDFLRGGASPCVKTGAGQVVQGDIRGLSQVTRRVDNKPWTIDLKKEIEVTVSKPYSDIPWLGSVYVVVEAKQDTNVLASLKAWIKETPTTVSRPNPRSLSGGFGMHDEAGTLNLNGELNVTGVAGGAGKDIRPPTFSLPAARTTPGVGDAPLVLQLPGTISDVACGGGGRFLLLSLKNIRKLAVFDVNAADVVKMISLPSRQALVAAGARKLLILFPDERLLQRWDLRSLQREGGMRHSPIRSSIRRLVLGSDSDGPALAYWYVGSARAGSQSRLSFINLDTLKVMKIGSVESAGRGGVSDSGGSFASDGTIEARGRLRASAGGSLYTMWETGVSGGSVLTFSVRGSAITVARILDNQGLLIPGPDGRAVFSGSGGRLDAAGKPIGTTLAPQRLEARPTFIPTPDPFLYLSIRGLPGVAFDAQRMPDSPAGGVTLSVHRSGDGSSLLTVYGLDEMAATARPEDWHDDDFTIEKRFYFVPQAHVLVTIPPSNDRLVLRRLEIDQALAGDGGDRPAVLSLPTLTATAGRQLVHQMKARSKKGPINYSLGRGPDGLEVDREGKVTWMVPQSLQGRDVTAVIVVGDASGLEVYHTLRIHVY